MGGGNNSAGCADLMCLDLGGLATGQALTWSSVAKAEPRSAIASEGPPGSLSLANLLYSFAIPQGWGLHAV